MSLFLIEGENLFDGNQLLTREPAAVLFEGERIVAVGQEAAERKLDADKIISCPGQTLMPGMIDCHNHLSLDPRLKDYLIRMQDPIPELTLRAVETMKIDLLSGVTTARCLGDKSFLDVHCKNAQAEDRIAGPKLLVATRGIRTTHGHGFVGDPYCGVDYIRQAVRENLLAGADLIKIYLTGTLIGKNGIPCYFSDEEIRTLVEEAHRVSVPVATHCIGGPAVQKAAELGIDVIEHGYFVTEEDLAVLEKKGCWMVLTPSIFYTEDRLETLHGDLKRPHLEQRDKAGETMKKVIQSNVKYAIGTDGMHGRLADEVEYVVKIGGASEIHALQGVTSRAAEVCRISDTIGTIEAGKCADIIGVNGNPVEDITLLKDVATVVQNGTLVKN